MWLLDKFLIAFACLPPIHLLWFSISAERPGLCTAHPALWKLGLEMSRVVGCSHLSPRLCSYNYLTYLLGVSGLRSCGGAMWCHVVPVCQGYDSIVFNPGDGNEIVIWDKHRVKSMRPKAAPVRACYSLFLFQRFPEIFQCFCSKVLQVLVILVRNESLGNS
jgi:hypothetical protein